LSPHEGFAHPEWRDTTLERENGERESLLMRKGKESLRVK